MTAVAVELLTRPTEPGITPAEHRPALPELAPDAVELIADTDKLMTMCACSASSDVPY